MPAATLLSAGVTVGIEHYIELSLPPEPLIKIKDFGRSSYVY